MLGDDDECTDGDRSPHYVITEDVGSLCTGKEKYTRRENSCHAPRDLAAIKYVCLR